MQINNEYNACNVFIETQIVDFIICDINIKFVILPEKITLENIPVLIILYRHQNQFMNMNLIYCQHRSNKSFIIIDII